MHKSSIPAAAAGALFGAAVNAAEKGLAQWFTPIEFGERLTVGLPNWRRTVVDLTCGQGHLIAAAANRTTEIVLGADLCPLPPRLTTPYSAGLRQHFIESPMADLHALLREVGFITDLVVLNPPFGQRWPRQQLAALADSDLKRVREAFAGHDKLGRDTIDSTAASLLVALDLLTAQGEGLLIGNEATLQRLFFAEGAPHAAILPHFWWHQVFPGNPCLPPKEQPAALESGFQTGVVWFSSSHTAGLRNRDTSARPDRRRYLGAEAREFLCAETEAQWNSVRDELQRRRSQRPHFNLSLAQGRIRVDLTPFEEFSGKIDKEAAKQLVALQDKRPEQLVVQRAQRDLVRRLCGLGHDTPWRVEPALIEAIETATRSYERARAPLYPLSPTMRIGYLDEQDSMLCTKTLGRGAFVAGRRYALRSGTIDTLRKDTRPNLAGELEDFEIVGQDLELVLTDEHGDERRFLPDNLKDPKVKFPGFGGKTGDVVAEFTLTQLIEHFEIPDVPDVATIHPDRYSATVAQLHAIEDWMNQEGQPTFRAVR